MITFNVNGTPKSIPASWDDILFGQYLSVLKLTQEAPEDDTIKLLARLIDIDYETLRKAEIKGFEKVLIALDFLIVPPVWNQEQPERIGKFILPKDITLESVGQYEDMKAVFVSNREKPLADFVACYPLMVGIYLAGIGQEYDYEHAKKIAIDLEKYPAREVVEAATFFITKLIHLTLGTPPNYLSHHQPISLHLKLSRMFTRLLASLQSWIKSLSGQE